MQLYPLLFEPIFKEKIWGGTKLKNILSKNVPEEKKIGESWEISDVSGSETKILNGFLKGKFLKEIIADFGERVLGKKIYKTFKNNFPLLIKFIDASDVLSVQVHPDDIIARKKHNSAGKTEMWYVLEAEKNSEIISGIIRNINKETFINSVSCGKIEKHLNKELTEKGDVFFIPPGHVHAIGKGILLAEIQQSSDITYRIFDWNRADKNGKTRELHIEQAFEVINFDNKNNSSVNYEKTPDFCNPVVENKYFTCNYLPLKNKFEVKSVKDSFIIYLCIEGKCKIETENNTTILEKGTTVLIPAEIKEFLIIPVNNVNLLEVYV